jgi:hypothetical protein
MIIMMFIFAMMVLSLMTRVGPGLLARLASIQTLSIRIGEIHIRHNPLLFSLSGR